MRVNFINWRPDVDDFPNDGLVKAQNCVHEPEGYKPVFLAATVTQTGNLASVSSIAAKPVGAQGDLFCAWITDNTLYVGVNGVTATTASTGYPVSFASVVSGTGVITAFDVCEYGGLLFFTAEAQGTTITPSGTQTIRAAGYATV